MAFSTFSGKHFKYHWFFFFKHFWKKNTHIILISNNVSFLKLIASLSYWRWKTCHCRANQSNITAGISNVPKIDTIKVLLYIHWISCTANSKKTLFLIFIVGEQLVYKCQTKDFTANAWACQRFKSAQSRFVSSKTFWFFFINFILAYILITKYSFGITIKHTLDTNTGNDTHSKKSNSPYSTAANAATTQPLNDRGTENTNPNMLCNENERLLMLQRFASNNYCSSDESDDSFGTENKRSNQWSDPIQRIDSMGHSFYYINFHSYSF